MHARVCVQAVRPISALQQGYPLSQAADCSQLCAHSCCTHRVAGQVLRVKGGRQGWAQMLVCHIKPLRQLFS